MKKHFKETINGLHEEIVKWGYEDIPEDYVPPVFAGFHYVSGYWHGGKEKKDFFKIASDDGRFNLTWRPGGLIRREWGNGSIEHYEERISLDTIEMISRLKGEYYTTYTVSKDENGNLRSVPGEFSLTQISYYDAMEMAAEIDNYPELKFRLPYGAEIDSRYQEYIDFGKRIDSEIGIDSTYSGNFKNSPHSTGQIALTGEDGEDCGFFGTIGNVAILTQERYASCVVVRGSSFHRDGNSTPAGMRLYGRRDDYSKTVGMQLVVEYRSPLLIKRLG